jgi:biopolymer transport protein ExbD
MPNGISEFAWPFVIRIPSFFSHECFVKRHFPMRIPSPIPKRRSRIVIIPLIDIMFFLLASFMMVALEMSKTENIKVNLPPATQSRQDFRPDMVNIAVDKSGAVWLEKKQISLADLASSLKDRFHANPDVPVYISGDRDTLHGDMVKVYQTVRAIGIQKVAFMTESRSDPTTP